jgi:hypothetical protein
MMLGSTDHRLPQHRPAINPPLAVDNDGRTTSTAAVSCTKEKRELLHALLLLVLLVLLLLNAVCLFFSP